MIEKENLGSPPLMEGQPHELLDAPTKKHKGGSSHQTNLALENQIEQLTEASLINTCNMFLYNQSLAVPSFQESTKLKLKVKTNDLFQTSFDHLYQEKKPEVIIQDEEEKEGKISQIIDEFSQQEKKTLNKVPVQFLKFFKKDEKQIGNNQLACVEGNKQIAVPFSERPGGILSRRLRTLVKPKWHAPWKLMKVISGHHGWVRCVDVDPTNQWFVTGSNDRTIKFWDLSSGQLKLSLTGHISSIRSVVVSKRHTYMFSCGEDKSILCWDLETNKVIRRYHGHLSGVYSLAQHPTLDLLASGGRDATVRLWDIRTKTQVQCLGGHKNVVESVVCQEFEPQVVSGSHDKMIRLWDIGMGRTIKTLTHHKKSIRALAIHPKEYTFCSAAADNVKVWKCPEGEFLRNMSGHNSIINTCAINDDNVMVTGGDNGTLHFWDWESGYNFQTIQSKPQPGSISSEAGIFEAKFDKSSMRLITTECDKTIKIWGEDEEATPETHPIDKSFRTDFVNQRF